ncbi:MAG: Crp/Fnr family transcriptional regulator [Clostridia bacterium]|nr:Crp/Fnr family transcriptional regulator [Clostridia bacterium]
MHNYIEILKQCNIFANVEHLDIIKILSCLHARKSNYLKGEHVYNEGDHIIELGIVLSGEVHIVKRNYYGNENIIANITSGNIFAESAAFSKHHILQVDVIAVADSEILFLDYKRIISPCANTCAFHTRLIENMITVIADKNAFLNQKLGYISKRSTKEKLLSYLFDQSKATKSNKFKIPFNREQLANYLSVDRSAMSNELCKLRDAGIITFHKNQFEMLQRFDD